MVDDLNCIHNKREGELYWQYLLLPFVQLFVERVVDRFHSINVNGTRRKLTQKQYVKLKSNCISDPLSFFRVEEYVEDLIVFDIERFFGIHTSHNAANESGYNFHIALNKVVLAIKTWLRHVKKTFKFLMNIRRLEIQRDDVVSRYSYEHNILIINDFIPEMYINKLLDDYNGIRLKELSECLGYRYFGTNKAISHDGKFSLLRKSEVKVQILDNEPEYMIFIKNHLFSYMPIDYLENYKNIRANFISLKVKFLIGNSLVFWDSLERHAIADQVAKGAQILIFQHGGGYGFSDLSTFELMEREFADRFVGWTDTVEHKGLVLRKAYFEINADYLSAYKRDKPIDVLIIGPWFKKFQIYNEGLHPLDNLSVTNKIKLLISFLVKSNLNVVYRAYQNFNDDISLSYPALSTAKNPNIYEQINTASIVVCCKPTTAVNDCLVAGNYPILFWGDEYCMKPNVWSEIRQLGSLGYYYDQADDCAAEIVRKISKLNYDVDLKVVELFGKLFGDNIATYSEVNDIICRFMVGNSCE